MTGLDLLLPFRDFAPTACVELAREAEALGYDGVWAAELAGHDAIALLAAVAARTERIRLGTAIVPVSTRSAALLGMGAATLADLAPGRIVLGVGVSSRTVIERWHDAVYDGPLAAVRDTLTVVRQAFGGEPTDHDGVSRSSHGFRLTIRPKQPPPLYIAALGPAMRALAAEQADGVILNFTPVGAAAAVCEQLRSTNAALAVMSLVRVAVAEPGSHQERRLRREFASYLRFAQYRRWMHSLGYGEIAERIGRLPTLEAMTDAVPDELFHEVTAVGDVEHCRRVLAKLRADGVTPIVVPSAGAGAQDAVRAVVAALAS